MPSQDPMADDAFEFQVIMALVPLYFVSNYIYDTKKNK
jgi:hypothetical protein